MKQNSCRPKRKAAPFTFIDNNIPEDTSDDELPPENEDELLNSLDESDVSNTGEDEDSKSCCSSEQEECVSVKNTKKVVNITPTPKQKSSVLPKKNVTIVPTTGGINNTKKNIATKSERSFVLLVDSIEVQKKSPNISKKIKEVTFCGATPIQTARKVAHTLYEYATKPKGIDCECEYIFTIQEESTQKLFTYLYSVCIDDDGISHVVKVKPKHKVIEEKQDIPKKSATKDMNTPNRNTDLPRKLVLPSSSVTSNTPLPKPKNAIKKKTVPSRSNVPKLVDQ